LYKIDRGIPTPPQERWNKKYPFSQMEVGDSFAVKSKSELSSAKSSARDYAERHKGFRVTIKTTRESPEIYGRVWRIN
jgi:hypothetical protein